MQDINHNPLKAAAEKRKAAKTPPSSGTRRTIGPIPPRDKYGRLQIAPVVQKCVKLNDLGEPVKDANGNPVIETRDTRDPREYAAYEVGQVATPESIKNLFLWRVDMVPEPIALVYAKNEDDAVKVYQKEFGITRFGAVDPKVTEVIEQ